MDRSDIKRQWQAMFIYLEGRTIQRVQYMEDKNPLEWDRTPMMLILDDGTAIYASQDDEGNGAGALFLDPSKEAQKAELPMCAPVI